MSATTSITSEAKSAAPAASPSRPSMRLKALATPIIQTSVTAKAAAGGSSTTPTHGTDKTSTRPPSA
jgi:hypothetical protein